MKQTVLLQICGKQYYDGQEPDTIELVTEGTLEYLNDGWEICYEESELTGLAGVTTVFRLEPDRVILDRRGRLCSQMVFQVGMVHESLYQTEYGGLMISVCAKNIAANLTAAGGTVELVYTISVENTAAGIVEYYLQIEPIKK